MFCGVFGHKPTPGWLSTDGHRPDSTDDNWPAFLTIAPMTRYPADLPIILKAMTQSETAITQLNKKVHIDDVKFFYIEHFPISVTTKVDREIISGIRKFVNHLEQDQNIKVQKIELPEMKYAFEAAVTILLRLNGVDTIFSKESDPDEWRSVFVEFVKFICLVSPHSLSNVGYGVIKRFSQKLPDSYYEWMCKKNEAIKRRVQDILGDNGVLICPTFTSAAHYPYEIYPKICNVIYMMIFNALGLPVTQCPIGFNSEGLPIGFQIVGNVNNDHLTIAVAQEAERAFGGWHEPPCERSTV
ncbi:fatty-acid amide hydrolase 2-like [Chelonus insularis]|uniref:fatty-acid amide hydrolase 2-like n=1 Tax=Chelonus insularis TaxID=460826 RepID=UPI00158E3A12|nr:fatty-acid amide hydrolase 2-like [Chelonus insularis]